jgi:hypothetical protein
MSTQENVRSGGIETGRSGIVIAPADGEPVQAGVDDGRVFSVEDRLLLTA